MIEEKKETSSRAILQEIGEVHAAERGSISLTRLPDDFYERAASHLRSTLARIENAKAGSEQTPTEEYYRLTEEYRRSKDILMNIYNTRERKIVLMAMNSARKISQSTEAMVHDEMDLFFSLKFELEKIRERIMKVGTRSAEPIRGETGINTPLVDYVGTEPEDPPKPPPRKKGPLVTKEPEKPKGPEPLDVTPMDPKKDVPDDLVLVRALKDIATFMCPDNTSISMKKEDVALLPPEIADILKKGGFVEHMGGSDTG
jgi:DNA replication initiation complex subunit (GINS family)